MYTNFIFIIPFFLFNDSYNSNLLNKTVSDSIQKTPVVYLMDSRVSKDVVYRIKTYRDLGTTNSYDISLLLSDIKIDDRFEIIHPEWHRVQKVIETNPDLIIIHYSCFYDVTNRFDELRRFQHFVEQVARANGSVHFIVYSRGASITEKVGNNFILPFKLEQNLKMPGLSKRIHPIRVLRSLDTVAKDVFCDQVSVDQLKAKVREILKLQ